MASISTGRLSCALAVIITGLCSIIGLGAAPASAAAYSVTIKQYAYTSAALTITQGDTVTWTNQDSVEHDVMVTSGPAHFHSPMLAKGETWSHTFTEAGSYSYICSVHPDMKGGVTVRSKPTPAKPATQQTTVTPVAPVTTPTASTASTAHTSHSAGSPTATASAAPVGGPAASATIPATVTTGSEATLDPLLIVAGASTAVMVFCLLLLSSRPAHEPVAVEAPADDPVPDPED